MPGYVLRGRDGADPLFGRFAGRCNLVASHDQQYFARPEGDRGDAVADHIEPQQGTVFRDGVYTGNEEIGQQALAPDFQLLRPRHRRVETVEQAVVAVPMQVIDDTCGFHRHRIPETDRFRGGGPNFFPQNLPGLFGRCGDPGFESAPDEIPAAAFQCFVHGGVI